MRMMSRTFTIPMAALLVAACGSSNDSTTTVTSQAYGHHDSDKADTANFVNVYPSTAGTRLDSCQTCHKSFVFTSGNRTTTKSVCDYCHLVNSPDLEDDGTPTVYDNGQQPTSIAQTLNAFGLAYKEGGRSQAALRAIASQDSDGDGYASGDEIVAGRYPGDANSNPGLEFGPKKIITVADVQAMPVHSEFLLSNSQKQQYDNYATYNGVKIDDLLQAVGVTPNDPNIVSVTVIAPDGFARDYPRRAAVTQNSKQYWFDEAYPSGEYYPDLDAAGLGTACGFVEYPNPIPGDRIGSDGKTILDDQWLMLAYQRDGTALEPAYIDPANLRLNGEGPLRLIVPQKAPGQPDRGADYSPTSCGDGYDYNSQGNLDHNAGSAIRGVIAIKINAVAGATKTYEEFDYQNGGYDYLANGQLVIFGYGIQ